MAYTFNAVCPYCAATNRIPKDKPASAAKCGKCGKAVFAGVPVELTGKTFTKHLNTSEIPLVVDFWADWCGPCKAMAPAFKQAAKALEPKARLAKINTQKEQSLAARFRIQAIPTMVIFKGGREVARQSGAMTAKQIQGWVNKHL